MYTKHIIFYVIVSSVWTYSSTSTPPSSCNVAALTESGWVCGLTRWAEEGTVYASFRGVPYAKQPVGNLRFKPLQPAEPWGTLDATTERCVCDQTDVLYGDLMQSFGMNEACIYANIHVPLDGLPVAGLPPKGPGLPIFVFIHGGGFAFGSGDSDIYGPEYLVTKNVIVITFNYRLNFFGFFTMNTLNLPGNNGLRDMVTLLQWVQRNARNFGGNPDDVTIGGQSAGAAAAHLLTLSKATEGLFSRAIIMSGTAISPFFTTAPRFSKNINGMFLAKVGINSTDPDEIYDKLLTMPVEQIHAANKELLNLYGLTTFFPIVEDPLPGITTIIDKDPSVLVKEGRGKHIPLIIGFTDAECYLFQRRFEQIDIVTTITHMPSITVPQNILYTSPQLVDLAAEKMSERYFNDTKNLDGFIKLCTESYYQYPAIKLAEQRALSNGAPVYLYQFSYDAPSVFRYKDGLNFTGAAHAEDLTNVLKVNSVPPFRHKTSAQEMIYWMTKFVTNFMHCSAPVCSEPSRWCPVSSQELKYQDIRMPLMYYQRSLTKQQKEMVAFYDELNGENGNGIK